MNLEGPLVGNVVRAASLQGLSPRLVHGFSTALPKSAQQPFAQAAGACLSKALKGIPGHPQGLEHLHLMVLEQIHSARVLPWNGEAPPLVPPQGDGILATHGFGGFIAIRTADCVPVLAVNTKNHTFAALHAGWRGTSALILPHFLALWQSQGADLQHVRLVFGPSIKACCFEVKQDCLQNFSPEVARRFATPWGNAWKLDLDGVLQEQACQAGVPQANIETLKLCTCCWGRETGAPPFASYRRSTQAGVALSAYNASFIGLLPLP